MPMELFGNGELWQATYATLSAGPTNSSLQRQALVINDFTEAQFDSFAQRYPEIITQFTDTTTGFSASVFKDSTSATGNLTIAFRGTEFSPTDLATDQMVLGDGAGFDQIMTMYNWWQLVSGTPGQNVSSVQ